MRERRGIVDDKGRLEMEREEEDRFSLGMRIGGREGEEEDLEGMIPQGPSGNSIGFWFPSQRKLNFAKSEKLFCKIIRITLPAYFV